VDVFSLATRLFMSLVLIKYLYFDLNNAVRAELSRISTRTLFELWELAINLVCSFKFKSLLSFFFFFFACYCSCLIIFAEF
jgi:hypothetical protein